ncbi:MAG: hypothetical protein ACLTUY_06330 [Roseburia sp.]
MKPVWGQKAPPKHANGGSKRPQNHKVGAESAPAQIRAEKVWGQKVPSKCKSGGKKRRQNSKVTAKSATTQISEKKVMVAESAIKMEKWWRKTPLKQQSDGKKRHHISNCGGILTTTYHIQGAGAPAKTKNYVNADAFIFFREKVRPFPHLAKPISRTFGKDEKSNGTDKKRLV